MSAKIANAISTLKACTQFPRLVELAETHYPKLSANPLAIISRYLSEEAYSRMIAYLLDSEEDHELGTRFFEEFFCESGLLTAPKFAASSVRCQIEWQTSQGRYIDVLVRAASRSGEESIIGIENKLWAAEQFNQLSDYQLATRDSFPLVQHRALLFISPDGREPTTADSNLEEVPVVQVTYDNLLKAIDRCHGFACDKRLPAANFLQYFSELVRHNLIPGEEAMREAKSMVREMAADSKVLKAIDLIREAYEETLTTRNLFYEHVIRRVREEHSSALISWHYPSSSIRPHEFNFEIGGQLHHEISRRGYSLVVMSLVQSRGSAFPRIGDEVHTFLMAYNFESMPSKKERDELRKTWREFLDRLPTAMGSTREWGPWVCLWSGNTHSLQDMAEMDGEAIGSNIAETFDVARAAGFLVE